MVFLLDWELTLKCNLDCSYCGDGHDNSTRHPPVTECLDTLAFMFKYVDLHMKRKPKGLRHVVLNVYGGESLYHPNILEILQGCKKQYKIYQDNWNLTVTTTTNLILPSKKLEEISNYIDEFTCSFHSESTPKQKSQFKSNLLKLQSMGRRVKCVILMHADPELFQESKEMLEWCKNNNIKRISRQLDHGKTTPNYNKSQVVWFDKQYLKRSYDVEQSPIESLTELESVDLFSAGRACCGGRQICTNGDRSQRHFFIENHFRDWYCSVDEFFLYVKQVSGEIYTNKDCKMNHEGYVGPIGQLSESDKLLEFTAARLETQDRTPIQCKKNICLCGLCAPKAKNQQTFEQIMKLYRQQ